MISYRTLLILCMKQYLLKLFFLWPALLLATPGCLLLNEDSKRTQVTYSSGYMTDAKGETVLVFIHGVTGDAVSSWTNEKTGAYFPALLGEAIPSSSVYRVGYYTPKFSRASTITEIATRTLQNLKDDGVFENHKNVHFIAHSMGGLIAKAMLSELNRPSKVDLEYLDKVKAVIFLSTPSHGADLAVYASWISMNPQFAGMKPDDLNSFLQILENSWQNLLRDRDQMGASLPRSFCAYETLPGNEGLVAVDRGDASTRCDLTPYPVDVSHSEISRPSSNTDRVFVWVRRRIEDTNKISPIERQPRIQTAETGMETARENLRSLVAEATIVVAGDWSRPLMLGGHTPLAVPAEDAYVVLSGDKESHKVEFFPTYVKRFNESDGTARIVFRASVRDGNWPLGKRSEILRGLRPVAVAFPMVTATDTRTGEGYVRRLQLKLFANGQSIYIFDQELNAHAVFPKNGWKLAETNLPPIE